jgi:hypothetical protein
MVRAGGVGTRGMGKRGREKEGGQQCFSAGSGTCFAKYQSLQRIPMFFRLAMMCGVASSCAPPEGGACSSWIKHGFSFFTHSGSACVV